MFSYFPAYDAVLSGRSAACVYRVSFVHFYANRADRIILQKASLHGYSYKKITCDKIFKLFEDDNSDTSVYSACFLTRLFAWIFFPLTVFGFHTSAESAGWAIAVVRWRWRWRSVELRGYWLVGRTAKGASFLPQLLYWHRYCVWRRKGKDAECWVQSCA
jgi:hypothetical protein